MKLEKWKNKWKEWSNLRKWQIWKLKLIDARLYFVSIFVGLLTGLVAVPYHYLLWYFFDVRKTFFTAHYPWYWHVLLFFILWGILIFVASLVKRMPLIAGGGIPQTRAANNGRIRYEHPFKELVAKFCGGVLALSAGLSLGREGPSVQIGSYIGTLISRWGHILKGERKQCKHNLEAKLESCFQWFKDTNLKANHNEHAYGYSNRIVVSNGSKILI